MDRAKFSTQQQVNIFVYTKDPYPPGPCRCRCADAVAHPQPYPQILLCTGDGYPDRPARSWGWISAADVAGSLDGTGVFLVEHFIYSVDKPLLLYMEGQTETAHISVGSRRCSRRFCHFSTECFLDVPSQRLQRPLEVCVFCRKMLFVCRECKAE